MDIDLAITQLGKNDNEYTLNADKTAIAQWRGSAAQPTTSELNAAWTEYEAKVGYKAKRQAEYPSLVDQLDDIYHNGIDAWKATIKATKDKYPKG